MKQWLTIILFSTLLSNIQAQSLADSILWLYENIDFSNLPESEKILYDTNRHYFTQKLNDSAWIEKVLEITIESSTTHIAERFDSLIQRHCLEKLQTDLSENQRRAFQKMLSSIYENQAYYLSGKGKLKESLALYFKALDLKKESRDTLGTISSLQNIGVSYFNIRDLESAKKFWNQAMELHKLSGDSTSIIKTLDYLGTMVVKEGKFEEGRKYFFQSLSIARKQKQIGKEAFALKYIGHLYYDMNQFDSAIFYYKNSLEIYESLGNPLQIPDLLFAINRTAIADHNWDMAYEYAEKALEASKKAGHFRMIMNAERGLYEIHKKKGNYKQSLEAYEAYNKLYDSLNNEEAARALYDQQYKFEYEQKAKIDSVQNAAALEIKAAESKQRRTIANFSLTGLVIAILFALILWNRFSVTRKQKLIIEKANEKLQSLDQLKSTLFTNISHEFRTPLTVITGMAQQIRSKPEKWVNKGSEMILRNGNQLLNLVNQILELRKLEAGSLQVNLVHQDLIAYLRYIFESFHSLAESKDITMSFTAEPTKLMMDYDPEKIIRIISNLFSNAIKFTNENGHIDFTVNLWEEKEESFIQIKIDDNGQGIKPESLPYIFDRFYQVPNSSNTNPGEGTGIGLALVKELVELMGGRIEVS
ncbi:MAG: hypothetical protein KDD63_19125, partial [Bacteroidetes bacterium]|nr:hypothetical protein [Bacteroidota bacterium]